MFNRSRWLIVSLFLVSGFLFGCEKAVEEGSPDEAAMEAEASGKEMIVDIPQGLALSPGASVAGSTTLISVKPIAISAGFRYALAVEWGHAIAIKGDDTVWVWGDNTDYALLRSYDDLVEACKPVRVPK